MLTNATQVEFNVTYFTLSRASHLRKVSLVIGYVGGALWRVVHEYATDVASYLLCIAFLV